jgi:hypothetical protein
MGGHRRGPGRAGGFLRTIVVAGAVAIAGFLAAQAFGSSVTPADTTPGTTTPVTTIPTPDPPPVTKKPPAPKPKPPVRHTRVVPRVVHVSPPPPPAAQPAPVYSPPRPAVTHKPAAHRPARSRRRHRHPSAVRAPPPPAHLSLRALRSTLAAGVFSPASVGPSSLVSEAGGSRSWLRLLGVAVLGATALLSLVALLPARLLPPRVATGIVDLRTEFAVSGLIVALAFAIAFILVHRT